jgi:microcystin-dependent protein
LFLSTLNISLMQDPFIGQVIMFGGTYAPYGWNFCDGTLLSINDNPALFNVIGTTYGGDGVTNFALPDLRGRMAVGQGLLNNGGLYNLGQVAGSEGVTISQNQLPNHTHQVVAANAAGTSAGMANNYLGSQPLLTNYAAGTAANDVMNGNALTNAVGGQPHNNVMPLQAISYIIALEGIYPSQS